VKIIENAKKVCLRRYLFLFSDSLSMPENFGWKISLCPIVKFATPLNFEFLKRKARFFELFVVQPNFDQNIFFQKLRKEAIVDKYNRHLPLCRKKLKNQK
jgi:hypothetical protein